MVGVTNPCPFCGAAIDPTVTHCPWCDNVLAGLLATGSRVGSRFEVLAPVGTGPHGTLYRARDAEAGAEVLLRRVADELLPGLEERGAFAHQAQSFAGRALAGCVMPLAAGVHEGFAWVAAPAIAGVTLRAVLDAAQAAGRELSLEESLRVLCAIAGAMAAMHAVTAHGALWPEHVVLTARGAVLTDGALASACAPERWAPRLGTFRELARYVAPEVAGRKKVTATADLFGFGAIAAELLCGEPSAAALASATHLNAEVRDAVRVLLDRDRSKRAGGVTQLLDALGRACGFERRPPDVPNPMPGIDVLAAPSAAPPPARSVAAPASAPAAPPRGVASNAPIAPPPVVRGAVSGPARGALPAVPGSASVRASQPPPPPPAARASQAPPPSPASAERRGPAGPDFSRIPRGGLPGREAEALPPQPASGAPMPLLPKMPAAHAPPPPRMPTLPSVPGLGAAPKKPAATAPAVPRMQSQTPASTAQAAAPKPRERNLDDIDPRLLRAARKLQAERDAGGDTIDDADLEEIADD